jgi:hypothetical protein
MCVYNYKNTKNDGHNYGPLVYIYLPVGTFCQICQLDHNLAKKPPRGKISANYGLGGWVARARWATAKQRVPMLGGCTGLRVAAS